MNIRQPALEWMRKNYPSENLQSNVKASKYYSAKGLWFLTINTNVFSKSGNLKVILENQKNSNEFYFLKIPISFFTENKEILDIRKNGKFFDIHLSALDNKFLTCTRSKGSLNFEEFLQTK
ncbi:MAG: hypothetical protein K0U15_06315 [Proteobacteria bacterium]|nr:hypothetical protein [Pseudomonadota bacterium]